MTLLIAQISDTHIKGPGQLAYGRVDTADMLKRCVAHIVGMTPQPDVLVITGDLVDLGRPAEYAHLQELLAPLHLPMVLIPGNHDERDALRRAFPAHTYLPQSGFMNFCIEDSYALRIIGLDTVVPGHGHGHLCAERLDWLAATLERSSNTPTLILMHHPPFATGIAHMDAIGLTGRDAFAAIVSRHPQIQAILCGHLHRHIHTRVGDRTAMTAPSPAHQVALDLRANGPSAFCMEPPGFLLHAWNGSQLISHAVVLGAYEGPFPFFDSMGQLIV